MAGVPFDSAVSLGPVAEVGALKPVRFNRGRASTRLVGAHLKT
jgi:hypothetical protein